MVQAIFTALAARITIIRGSTSEADTIRKVSGNKRVSIHW